MKISKLAIIGLIVAVTSVGLTVAYYSSRTRRVNKLSFGNNEISISENFVPPSELKTGMNVYKKQIQVKNTGTSVTFVRLFVDFSDGDAAKRSYIAPVKPSKVTISDGDDIKSKMEAAGYLSYSDFWSDREAINNWVYIPEEEDVDLGGYFYYTKAIKPGESTEELIDTIATYYATADEIKEHEVLVYAESVQTMGNNGLAFMNSKYKEAWKEFLTHK